jgi:hypothetical protein
MGKGVIMNDIPDSIGGICQNPPKGYIEKSKRYDADLQVMNDYILNLRTDIQNLEGRLDSLKEAEKLFEALHKIQEILNETVEFPIPCG